MPGIEQLRTKTLADQHHRTAISHVKSALDAVPRYAAPIQLERGLTEVVHALHRLTSAIHKTHWEEIDHRSIDSQSPAQTYFHIRNADLHRSELLLQITQLAERATSDLKIAPLAANDTDLILTAFRSVFNEFVPTEGPATNRLELVHDDPPQEVLEQRSQSEIWWGRWITAHQVHALFNTFAAVALHTASEHAMNAKWGNVIERLQFATTLVAAFGPTRAHALCLSPEHYQTVLRPSMIPPLFPVALSGRMHLEYKAYRESVSAFLETMPSTMTELVRLQPELALAREQLLEADMAETERHISLVWSMIGTDKSIVQSPRVEDNALSALRLIRDRRAALIDPYVRYAANPSAKNTTNAS